MLSNNKTSWSGYLRFLKEVAARDEPVIINNFNDFIHACGYVHVFFGQVIPLFYILDYRTGRYIKMSGNFAGYTAETFVNEGIAHTLEIYQRDHLKLFDKTIFPQRLSILAEISSAEHQNYIFSYNACVRAKDGSYQHYLQRSCFLSDQHGNPIFSMGIIANLNGEFKRNQVIQTVEKIDPTGLNPSTVIFRQNYQVGEVERSFSAREIEVLKYMSEGLSSKQIAHKMFLSEHTVVNHRRHMQDKSSLPNANALICYAVKSGLI